MFGVQCVTKGRQYVVLGLISTHPTSASRRISIRQESPSSAGHVPCQLIPTHQFFPTRQTAPHPPCGPCGHQLTPAQYVLPGSTPLPPEWAPAMEPTFTHWVTSFVPDAVRTGAERVAESNGFDCRHAVLSAPVPLPPFAVYEPTAFGYPEHFGMLRYNETHCVHDFA